MSRKEDFEKWALTKELDITTNPDLEQFGYDYNDIQTQEFWECWKDAYDDPAPPPQVVRGEGDDFRSDAVALAILFHETYERLAPQFGYETRPDTKQFDPGSKNGRLMVAVCCEIMAAQNSEYRANSEKLAGLVDTYIGPDGLRSTTPHQAVEEIRRLAALLAPKGKAP